MTMKIYSVQSATGVRCDTCGAAVIVYEASFGKKKARETCARIVAFAERHADCTSLRLP